MNDPRDEDGEDRIRCREADGWRTSRRNKAVTCAPPRRGRFGEEEDDYDDHAPNDPRRKVKGPGLAMVFAGWIGLVLSLALVGFGVATPFLIPPPPLAASVVYAGMGVLSAAANVLVIIGGSRMRQCRNRGLALTAAILCIASSLLFGPCGLFSVAFGIWALVVLLNADVKREFERIALSGARGTERW